VADLTSYRLAAEGREESRQSEFAPVAELQHRIEAGMEAMLKIRFLASRYPTRPPQREWIGTLGLDEHNTPVVVEYSTGADSEGLSRAASHLSWLSSARHEFEQLVRDRLGSGPADVIDWRSPRAVCIAADFSRDDWLGVHNDNRPIDLVRYRLHDGGLLSLMLIESAPGPPAPVAASPDPAQGQALVASDEGHVLYRVPASLRDLYEALHEALIAGGAVNFKVLQHYIAYRQMANRASVVFRPRLQVILLNLPLDPDTVELEEGFTRDMRETSDNGSGDLQVRIASTADLDKARSLIQQVFGPA
jgi:predicted transport protein